MELLDKTNSKTKDGDTSIYIYNYTYKKPDGSLTNKSVKKVYTHKDSLRGRKKQDTTPLKNCIRKKIKDLTYEQLEDIQKQIIHYLKLNKKYIDDK